MVDESFIRKHNKLSRNKEMFRLNSVRLITEMSLQTEKKNIGKFGKNCLNVILEAP